MKYPNHKLILTLTATILAVGSAKAFELSSTTYSNLPPIDFHGYLSQGFLDSSSYNYLGDTTRGSFLFSEAGFNASMNPFPNTRITAQAFSYDVGQDVGKYDVGLDYASIEYTVNDYFGVRAGRVRRPEGIYNDIQDVDLARTSVLLPQGMYDARWRDFYESVDGGEFFGTFPLSKAGSLSYETFAGVANPAPDGGLATYLRSPLPANVQLDAVNSPVEGGVQLWWNTPLNGLRIGGMGEYISGAGDLTTVQTPVGPKNGATTYSVWVYQTSVEYLWKSWTLQTEYYNKTRTYPTGAYINSDSWYVSAAYRFNKWFEAGPYYTEYYADTTQRGNSLDYQKDAALSLRFDLKSWWVFKVEGHFIHGTGLLEDSIQPTPQDDRGWFMLAVKTTFSF